MPIQPSSYPISNVPNVYVQVVPPTPVLTGVATNLIGVVGNSSWGPKNAPVVVGGIQQAIQYFGTPQPVQYDLVTAVYVANLQGASSFVCVRVTDGSDTAATVNLVDTTSGYAIPGAILTALYTGTTGNTLNAVIGKGSSYTASVPTYKLSLFLSGGIPEVFDNIGGTGNAFWQNLVDAVNMGQSVARGPSQLAVATLATGAGAATNVAPGTGYTVNDVLTVAGGTSTQTAQITVLTVTGGAIATFRISRSGAYTVFPTNPVSVTGGTGTGATFNLTQGAQNPPAQTTVTFSGGTNGGSVDTADLIGTDGLSRTGMYALRGSKANIIMLADADDETYWTDQVAFGYSEGIAYMIGTIAAGFQDNISGAVTLKQTAGIDAYDFKLMQGDWCQINDPYNNVTRFISQQSFIAGVLAVNRADGSSLNKPIYGIVATQKSLEGKSYSDSDLSQLYTGGLDVITLGIPATASAFGARLGINTSSNNQTNTDNYPRMINFLGNTILYGMSPYIGQTQTPDTRLSAKNAIQSFLSTLASSTLSGGPMIGDVNNPGSLSAAFKVTLDATNNPPTQVALGFMQCDVQVVLFSIIQYLVVNLDAAQNITIQALPPQTNT
jgi:hypothetical protein